MTKKDKTLKEFEGIFTKYKDLDFPVIPGPNRKYKIKAKIRKVYSGDPNPPLDLEL